MQLTNGIPAMLKVELQQMQLRREKIIDQLSSTPYSNKLKKVIRKAINQSTRSRKAKWSLKKFIAERKMLGMSKV